MGLRNSGASLARPYSDGSAASVGACDRGRRQHRGVDLGINGFGWMKGWYGHLYAWLGSVVVDCRMGHCPDLEGNGAGYSTARMRPLAVDSITTVVFAFGKPSTLSGVITESRSTDGIKE